MASSPPPSSHPWTYFEFAGHLQWIKEREINMFCVVLLHTMSFLPVIERLILSTWSLVESMWGRTEAQPRSIDNFSLVRSQFGAVRTSMYVVFTRLTLLAQFWRKKIGSKFGLKNRFIVFTLVIFQKSPPRSALFSQWWFPWTEVVSPYVNRDHRAHKLTPSTQFTEFLFYSLSVLTYS